MAAEMFVEGILWGSLAVALVGVVSAAFAARAGAFAGVTPLRAAATLAWLTATGWVISWPITEFLSGAP